MFVTGFHYISEAKYQGFKIFILSASKIIIKNEKAALKIKTTC